MKVLKGHNLARVILDDVKAKVATLKERPIIHVSRPEACMPYYRGIRKDAAYCGIDVETKPEFLHATGVISLDPAHTPDSRYNLDGGFMTPCTPEAIMTMLKHYRIPLRGKQVCVVGRSARVGRPLIGMLLDEDATVTCCHSKTGNVHWNMMGKDIIISCCGDAEFDCRDITSPLTIIVDVGDDFIDYGAADTLIPPNGGIGPVTRAVLMRHTYLKALEKERKRQ